MSLPLPPAIFTPPSGGGSPTAPGAVFTPPAGGGSPTAPGGVFAPPVGGGSPTAPGAVFTPPTAVGLGMAGALWVGGSGTVGDPPDTFTGLLQPAAAGSATLAQLHRWTSDGLAARTDLARWTEMEVKWLIVPVTATLAEIFPPAQYTADDEIAAADQVTVRPPTVGFPMEYWLYTDGESAPEWRTAGEAGDTADEHEITAGQLVFLSTLSGPDRVGREFVGGLGAAWRAAEGTLYRWTLDHRIAGSSAKTTWTKDAILPVGTGWTGGPTTIPGGIPSTMVDVSYDTGITPPPAIFQ